MSEWQCYITAQLLNLEEIQTRNSCCFQIQTQERKETDCRVRSMAPPELHICVIFLALKVIFNELTSKIVALNAHFIRSWSQDKECRQDTVGKTLFCSVMLGPQKRSSGLRDQDK